MNRIVYTYTKFLQLFEIVKLLGTKMYSQFEYNILFSLHKKGVTAHFHNFLQLFGCCRTQKKVSSNFVFVKTEYRKLGFRGEEIFSEKTSPKFVWYFGTSSYIRFSNGKKIHYIPANIKNGPCTQEVQMSAITSVLSICIDTK